MKKISVLTLFVLSSLITMAQENGQVEMADDLRKSGMIYVVVAVIAVVFLGIAAYLFSIDRRIKKLEEN